jgi:S1-C subfamily serine protease
LRVRTSQNRERPFVGLKVVELDKQHAEPRGVTPYSGLLVTELYADSAAKEAGIEAGDVVLSIGAQKTVYLEHVAAAEAKLTVGQPVDVVVVRGQDRLDLSLRAKVLRERVEDVQEVPLEAAELQGRPYAGVSLAGIPTSWCERIFGSVREAVVVTGVEVGSPAWLAGVRPGDIIDRVDGQPVPKVQELSARIVAAGKAEATMQWSVQRGPDRRHEATMELSDYSGESKVWIPFLFYLENGAYRDRWTLGPLGLLMRNKNTYDVDSSTREVRTSNVFSALLGLFRIDAEGDGDTEVRLLWLIRFDV